MQNRFVTEPVFCMFKTLFLCVLSATRITFFAAFCAIGATYAFLAILFRYYYIRQSGGDNRSNYTNYYIICHMSNTYLTV